LFLGSLWGEQTGTKHSWMEKSVLWWNMWVQEWHSTELRKHSKEDLQGRWEAWTRFLPANLSMFWKRNRKSTKSLFLRERDDCEFCWFYLVSYFWGMPGDDVLTRSFPKISKPPQTTLLSHLFAQKSSLLLQYRMKVVVNVFTWLKIRYTTSLRNWAHSNNMRRDVKLFPW
jgi:hypothetical protein